MGAVRRSGADAGWRPCERCRNRRCGGLNSLHTAQSLARLVEDGLRQQPDPGEPDVVSCAAAGGAASDRRHNHLLKLEKLRQLAHVAVGDKASERGSEFLSGESTNWNPYYNRSPRRYPGACERPPPHWGAASQLSDQRDDPRRAARAAAPLRGADDHRSADGGQAAEIGDVLEAPAVARQPGVVGLEVRRDAVVERERVDGDADGRSFLDQHLGRLDMEARIVLLALGIGAAELVRVHVRVPA